MSNQKTMNSDKIKDYELFLKKMNISYKNKDTFVINENEHNINVDNREKFFHFHTINKIFKSENYIYELGINTVDKNRKIDVVNGTKSSNKFKNKYKYILNHLVENKMSKLNKSEMKNQILEAIVQLENDVVDILNHNDNITLTPEILAKNVEKKPSPFRTGTNFQKNYKI